MPHQNRPEYTGPDRRAEPHTQPCSGLQEIQKMHAVMVQRVDDFEAWQHRQNGTLKEIRDEGRAESQATRTALQKATGDRQRQVDRVQKQISDNHTAILDRLAVRDRQMVMFLIAVLVVMRAPEIRALGDTIIKMFGG